MSVRQSDMKMSMCLCADLKGMLEKHQVSIGTSIQNKIKSHGKKEKGYFI